MGTECTLALEEVSIERLVAEARAVGLGEFLVFRNGEEILTPDQFCVQDGDLFVIADPKQSHEIEDLDESE